MVDKNYQIRRKSIVLMHNQIEQTLTNVWLMTCVTDLICPQIQNNN